MRAFLALLARDLRLAFREGSALGAALGFYLIVVAMLPLGLGPDMALLSRIAPGLLWLALLLSALLTLGIANGPWGPFVPLVNLQLVSVRLTDPASLRFDPFRSGRGIQPQGFVHALRRGVYSASQRARAGLRAERLDQVTG